MYIRRKLKINGANAAGRPASKQTAIKRPKIRIFEKLKKVYISNYDKEKEYTNFHILLFLHFFQKIYNIIQNPSKTGKLQYIYIYYIYRKKTVFWYKRWGFCARRACSTKSTYGTGTKNWFNKNRPWWWWLRHLLQKSIIIITMINWREYENARRMKEKATR